MVKLQVIEGGKLTGKAAPSNADKKSAATRFLYHDGRLTTLASELGVSQHAIAWMAVEMARAEGIETGKRAERARQRLIPPMGRAA